MILHSNLLVFPDLFFVFFTICIANFQIKLNHKLCYSSIINSGWTICKIYLQDFISSFQSTCKADFESRPLRAADVSPWHQDKNSILLHILIITTVFPAFINYWWRGQVFLWWKWTSEQMFKLKKYYSYRP